MKVNIEEAQHYSEPEVLIRCREIDESVKRVVAAIRLANGKLIGRQESRSFLLDAYDIFYFESVNDKVFICAQKEVFETPLRLYEIEARFEDTDFFRASKSIVANLRKIESVQAVFNGRFEARLVNGEKIIISRQYVPLLKKKLGL